MKQTIWFAPIFLLISTFGFITPQSAYVQTHNSLQTTLSTASLQRVRHNNSPLAPLTHDLALLYNEYTAYRDIANQSSATPKSFTSSNPLIRTSGDYVFIDAIADNDTTALLQGLNKLGMQYSASEGPIVSGLLPIQALDDTAALPSLRFARPAYALTKGGLVTSQGDAAIAADTVRTKTTLDGKGVTVGTLSDSFNCDKVNPATNASQDVINHDLPIGIQVLQDYNGFDCTDEGRAMMQIIADIAPGAQQQYHTAFNGTANFAQGIRALAAAGSDIIVDDIIYLLEPMFQDGIIAQAVNDVVAAGSVYFSAAGNYGDNSYESVFRATQMMDINGNTFLIHDFDPSANTDVFQQISIPARETISIVVQWDSPYKSAGGLGATSDLDVFLFSEPPGDSIIASSTEINIGKDPVEIVSFSNNTSMERIINICIGAVDGAVSHYLKYSIFGSGSIVEFPTHSATIYGHSNAARAIAVGAAAFYDTPRFGITPPQLERFSSIGATPLLFNPNGSRKPTPEIHLKPYIVAPDGGNTTFFGKDILYDPDTFPNFFGTSAAAPHAAGVTALLLQANPNLKPIDIFRILAGTSMDMGTAGFDNQTGFGLIQADQAIAKTLPDLAITKTALESAIVVGTAITYTIAVSNKALISVQDVQIMDTLPEDTYFIQATYGNNVPCAYIQPTVTCSVGTVEAFQHITATVVISSAHLGLLTNTAHVTSSSQESITTNNQADAIIQVVRAEDSADLSLSVSSLTSVLDPQTPISYSLTLKNNGPAEAKAITITTVLPLGVLFNAAYGEGWDCTQANNVITCTRMKLTIGPAPTITIKTMTPSQSGSIVYQATAQATTPDIRLSNNTVILTTTITPFKLVFLPLIQR